MAGNEQMRVWFLDVGFGPPTSASPALKIKRFRRAVMRITAVIQPFTYLTQSNCSAVDPELKQLAGAALVFQRTGRPHWRSARQTSQTEPLVAHTTMRGDSLMRNERNSQQTALLLFAVALIVATLMAFLTTFGRVDKRTATSETAPLGTTGLGKARPPL
jgi:hypothetical protein